MEMEYGNGVTAVRSCISCRTVHIINMTQTEMKKIDSGVHIQDALPNHSADDRELLVSGMCGKCFDKMFEGEF